MHMHIISLPETESNRELFWMSNAEVAFSKKVARMQSTSRQLLLQYTPAQTPSRFKIEGILGCDMWRKKFLG